MEEPGKVNYPHYVNNYDYDDNNTTTIDIVGYELYSFMCFLLLFLSICGASMCNRYYNDNSSVVTEYGRERLIKNKLEKYRVNDKFNEEECSICLDSYMEDEMIIYLECGHYYHNECSKRWFKEGKTCPLCRASFS